jgi:hypothetical protein
MTAPSVSTAFIDLATYGELEKRMYSREGYYRKDNRWIIIIVIIIVLFYLKKK